MAECKGCNRFVTDDYARVFGDNDDTIETCRNCRSTRTQDAGTDDDGPDDDRVLLRDVRDASRDDDASDSTDEVSTAERTRKRSHAGLSAIRDMFRTADG